MGALCAFLSSVTWAFGTAGYARLTESNSPFTVNLARVITALPLFLIAVFVSTGGWHEGLSAFGELTPHRWAWFLLSVISSYGLGDVAFLASARSLGVPSALAIASSYPLWTAMMGFLFRGEALHGSQVAGVLLTVGGVVLVLLHGSKRDQAHRGSLRKGALLAFAASLLWGLNSLSISQAGTGLNAAVGNSVRMVLALLIGAIVGKTLFRGVPTLLPRTVFVKYLWVFVLEAFVGSYFFIYGLSHTPLAVGATLSSLAPVLSVPISVALGMEKLNLWRTLGIVAVVLGVCHLIGLFVYL